MQVFIIYLLDYTVTSSILFLYKEVRLPKPLLYDAGCSEPTELGCADGTCLPNEYFCDGSVDCPDGSDEGWYVNMYKYVWNIYSLIWNFCVHRCDVNHDPNSASSCDPAKCVLPDCFCSKDGTIIPSRLEANQVPQMILLTFDDAINFENWDLYSDKIFSPERKNPNGCPIKVIHL